MKIIGGIWKGISLKSPDASLTRPTQERVKKSLFDILTPRVRESRVLDLFAGSGSLGIEALSRGAKEVTFVEWNPLCMKLLKENLLKLRGEKRVTCYEENALKMIGKLAKEKSTFDIVFMDPPYNKELTTKCLRLAGKYAILSLTAVLVVRHAKEEEVFPEIGTLMLWRQEHYGDTALSFYRKNTRSLSGEL